MTSVLSVGVIGCGRIGRVHAANVAASGSARLVVVADPVIDNATNVAAQFGAHATSDAEDVIRFPGIDAVIIASPTATHVPLIALAIESGVAVLCEKPIDLDIDRVDRLRQQVNLSGVPVAVGFNRRFDPHFAALHERVERGEIGDIEQLIIVSRDPALPPADYLSSSGGLFRDMAIHDLDMARFFLPDILQVSAVGSSLVSRMARDHGDVDSAMITLVDVNGRQVSIVNSRRAAFGYDQRLEVFGSRGMLQVANPSVDLVTSTTVDRHGARSSLYSFFIDRYAQSYQRELDEFLELVRGRPSTSPTFDDGRAALMLADAAQRSLEEGAAVAVGGLS